MNTKEPGGRVNPAGGTPNDGANEEARSRKAAADSLRRQIEKLKEGRRPPRTLHEFVEEKMSEDAERNSDH